ncbi:hypothetical protein [Cytobacillus firmus]|uniref:hypothetical protein n=1 Tax=Cytobacillus firmus TaxID=1399 RepID=UPI0022281FBE|nr:hypothetical protein [Cytobacillus firmus]
MPKGGVYRVYSLNKSYGAMGVGGGLYVNQYGAYKYETPSKEKLALAIDMDKI